MGKSTNLLIVDTKQVIMDVLQQSNLPSVVCSMIVHEISNNVDLQANQTLIKEKEMLEKANKIESDKAKKSNNKKE